MRAQKQISGDERNIYELEEAVERIRVQHPQYKETISRISDLIQRSGRVTDPGGMRVVAESGVGKSAIIQAIEELHPQRQVGNRQIFPVLKIKLEVAPTVKFIVSAMLRALNYIDTGRTSFDGTDTLKAAMVECGVLIIMVDEANHIGEGGRDKTGQATADWFKRFYDEVKKPIVFFGTPPGTDRMFQIDNQLVSRLPFRVEMGLFIYDTTFAGVLSVLDKNLPMPMESGLAKPPLSRLIHIATEGRMRTIVKLLKGAVVHAIIEESPRIEKCHLAAAYDGLFGSSPVRPNPFR